MTGFSAEWLALRAPADDVARDARLVQSLLGWAGRRALTIADIGGGSGAALRALGPHLPSARWRIYDNDADLLALVPKAQGVEAIQLDLARDLDQIFVDPPDLVTGFAFFDLVSTPWLAEFAARIARAGAALYAPLIYNGEESWTPAPPHEAEALAAFNDDMRRDKGLGPALGAGAPAALRAALEATGYAVEIASTPWRLTEGPLLHALASGSAGAVQGALPVETFTAWRAGRLAATGAEIGHRDVLALPPGGG